MKNSTFIYLLLLLLITACRKDKDEFIIQEETVSSLEIGVIGGLVTDTDGTPLNNTTIHLKTKDNQLETKTDDNGVFYFRNLELEEERVFLYTESGAYFQGSRTFTPKKGTAEFIHISLQSLEIASSFEATEGIDIDFPEGTQLNIAPNAIKYISGADYNGTVHIAKNFLSPNQSQLDRLMPGDLAGLDNQGNWQSLATYGMMAIELKDDVGALLKIANPDMAILRMPISETQLGSAPATINVWSFDAENGYWISAGTAQREDDYYITNIPNAQFINWAVPYPLINITTQIQLASVNAAYANALIEITVVGSGICAYAQTDDAGYLETTAAANQVLMLRVIGHCGTVVYESEIGPYGTNAQVGSVLVESNNTTFIELKGTLADCAEESVTLGYVNVQIGDNDFILFAKADGTFNTYLDACANTEFSLNGVNVGADTEGSALTFTTAETVDAGLVSTCD